MATIQINQLPPIDSGSVDRLNDVLPIVDNSTGVTHEITVENLKGALNVLLPAIQAGIGTNSSVRVDSNNTAIGDYSTVVGGQNNVIIVSGSCSGILSGDSNQASGSRSAIAGGTGNVIRHSAFVPNSGSFIGGGSNNLIYGQNGSTVVGGAGNIAGLGFATVVGGRNNTALTSCTLIGGGENNSVSDRYTYVEGEFGYYTGTHSSITSGISNTVYAIRSHIAGGTSGSICGAFEGFFYPGLSSCTSHQFIGSGFCNRIKVDTTRSGPYFGLVGEEGSSNSILNGSENLITGSYYISNNAILGGTLNQITSHISNCSGSNSTIGGGSCNTIASSRNSVIGGGTSNTMVSASIGTIAGGETNTLTGFVNTIGGGSNNTVTSPGFGTVSGGYVNCVTGERSNIAGGSNNTVSGTNSGILAGNGNTISGGCYSVIAGGKDNTINAIGSCGCFFSGNGTISGGNYNQVNNAGGTIGGGANNNVTGVAGNINGGASNTASGRYSTIGGGSSNTASNLVSVVGGGGINTASGYISTVAGGAGNTASGCFSFIGGGGGLAPNNNQASGDFSAILGGKCNNTNTCTDAMIVGSCITADRVCTAFVNNLSIKNIPTSSAGLPAGAVWSNSCVLTIV